MVLPQSKMFAFIALHYIFTVKINWKFKGKEQAKANSMFYIVKIKLKFFCIQKWVNSDLNRDYSSQI